MYTSLLLTALAAASSLVAAGPHGDYLHSKHKVRVVHRRHHARAIAGCDDAAGASPVHNGTASSVTPVTHAPATPSPSPSPSQTLPGNSEVLLAPADPGCTNGAYQCVGMTFQQCANGVWQTLSTCSGDNIVCSSNPAATGCVWSWSVPSTTPGTPSASPSPSFSPSVSPPPVVSASPSPGAPAASASPSATQDDDDDEYDCDEDDEVTTVVNGATTTIINNGLNARPTNLTVNPPLPGNKTQNSTTTLKLNPTVVTTTVDIQPTFATNGSLVNATKTLTTSVLVPSATPSRNSSAPVGNKLTFSAPHYVIYADYWLSTMPSVSDLRDFNRFILAFWMSNSGPVDNAQAWAWFSADYRKQVIAQYHAAGIALMVSAFGSTDAPTSWGYDPIKTAQKLAAFVVQYGLDGVDIDYEDMDAMNSNKAEAWLIPFQIELRRLLPSPYIISHAPVAPWFTSLNVYQSGAYVNIHKQVGSTIDFYNIQFYNQGVGVYTDCTTLLFTSGGWWPSTSVFEIHSYTGVPLDNIVIGKPLTSDMAANGYMDPISLNQCVKEAQAKGWNAGVMFWEWVDSVAPLMMATTRGLGA